MPRGLYAVHSIFGPTIQGEASMAGTPCLFLRLSLCNRWDGRIEHRERSDCPFCDTDFLAREYMGAPRIVDELRSRSERVGWVWVSGGEPAIQVDGGLLRSIRSSGYRVGMETNGSLEIPHRYLVDHLVCSPKQRWDKTVVREADDLKLLYPHPDPYITPEAFASFRARERWLQPIWADDPAEREENLARTIERLTTDLTGWRLSVQTHKYVGVE